METGKEEKLINGLSICKDQNGNSFGVQYGHQLIIRANAYAQAPISGPEQLPGVTAEWGSAPNVKFQTRNGLKTFEEAMKDHDEAFQELQQLKQYALGVNIPLSQHALGAKIQRHYDVMYQLKKDLESEIEAHPGKDGFADEIKWWSAQVAILDDLLFDYDKYFEDILEYR